MDLAQTAHEWLTRAEETHAFKARTVEGYAYCIGVFVRGGFRDVRDLTRERIYDFLESRRKIGIDPSTLNRNLAAICSFASSLERRGVFPLGRLRKIRRLRYRLPPRKPPFFLSHPLADQTLVAAARVDAQLVTGVTLAIASGVRGSELVAIHHEDLRLTETLPYLLVARDAARDPKTYEGRSVPLRRADAARLLELGLGGGRSGPVFPPEKHSASGPYLRCNTLGRRLAVVRAILPMLTGGPIGGKLDLYTLRHTFASWHVQEGKSIAKVAKWLGHRRIQVCYERYAALAPGGDADCERAA